MISDFCIILATQLTNLATHQSRSLPSIVRPGGTYGWRCAFATGHLDDGGIDESAGCKLKMLHKSAEISDVYGK